ncbi:hypothetical protein T484DRAFT_1986651, partial [Baffinella frigidus]
LFVFIPVAVTKRSGQHSSFTTASRSGVASSCAEIQFSMPASISGSRKTTIGPSGPCCSRTRPSLEPAAACSAA